MGTGVQTGIFFGEVALDLQSFKLDSVAFGVSKNSKTVKEIVKQTTLKTPSVQLGLNPLKLFKKHLNIDLEINATLSGETLISKTKISNKESEELYRLIKEEKN